MRLIRAAVAAVVLAVVIAGLPLALVRLGHWPITGLPSIEQWRDLPSTALTDTAVFGVLTVAAWIAWALFTTSVIVELSAEFTGRAPRTVPLAGPLQLGARQLVAAIVMTVAITGPFARHATAVPLQPRVAAASPATEVTPRPPTATAAPSAPSTAPVAITVADGDNPWDLAEQHLGDGMRWRELYDLNRGTLQPDGRAWTVPDQIDAGWILQLPPGTGPNANVAPTAATYIVEPGDTLSAIAETNLGDPNLYPEIAAATAPIEQTDGRHLTNPNLIRPGWEVIIPGRADHATLDDGTPSPVDDSPTSVPPSSDRPPTSAPPTVADTTPSQSDPVAPPAAPTPERHDGPLGAGPLGVAGAVAAASLGVALRRRRLRQRQHRPPHHQLPAPTPATEPVAVALLDTSNLPEAVYRTMGSLAAGLAGVGHPPVPRLAHLYDDRVELLMTDAAEPPAGWSADADGVVWSCGWQPDPEDRLSPVPALVSVGALDDNGILLNLETEPVVSVTGDAPAVTALVASMAVELGAALSPVNAVGTVGVALPTIAGLNVTVYPDLRAACLAATQEVDAMTAALAAAGASSPFELRCRCSQERFDPMVLFVAGDDIQREPDAFADLLEMAHRRAGLALIVVGAAPLGACEMKVAGETIALPTFGLVCAAQAFDLATLEAIAELFAVADPDNVGELVEELAALQLFHPNAVDALGPDGTSPRSDVVVRLLGSITVDGVAGLTPQQIAMMAFLTIHPNATGDALHHAIWAGQPPSRERFANTMHELRRVVGSDRLPPSVDGRYRLVGVDSDLARFESLRTAGDRRAALELVTGQPLTYERRHRRHFTWVDLGNHASRVEAVVADTAHDLVVDARARGDTSGAVSAAQQGLLASPTNETLTGDLIAAHMAAGDRSTAIRVLSEYERALEDMDGGEPPPAFYALVEQSDHA